SFFFISESPLPPPPPEISAGEDFLLKDALVPTQSEAPEQFYNSEAYATHLTSIDGFEYPEAVSPVPTETGDNGQTFDRDSSIGEIPYGAPDPNGFIGSENNMNGGSTAVSPTPYDTNGYNRNGYTGYNVNGIILGTNDNGSRKPAFNFQCLKPQTSVDNLPIPGNYHGNTSPTRSRLQNQHNLDSRPSSVSSMSSTSWANTAAAGATPLPGIIAPSGRRGKLIYTPMILVDQESGASQPLWSDGSASLPAGKRPGWYPGQTRTFTSMRMQPSVNQGLIDKGSADSLVESILISEGLGIYARDPKFVSFAKREIAEACHMSLDEMETAAADLIARGASHLSRFEDELADEMNCVISY
ncbi:hypothetical protein XENORESO_017874, partial [Xenotaenia resolanae]